MCDVSCDIGSCFFFKQKTAYEVRISDWSSDVCSSDLLSHDRGRGAAPRADDELECSAARAWPAVDRHRRGRIVFLRLGGDLLLRGVVGDVARQCLVRRYSAHAVDRLAVLRAVFHRSEEHTSELQSLMRTSYAVFCLNKKTKQSPPDNTH